LQCVLLGCLEAISRKYFDLISALLKKLTPRNIDYIAPVKFFSVLNQSQNLFIEMAYRLSAAPSGKIASGTISIPGEIKSTFILASVYRFRHGCQVVLYVFALAGSFFHYFMA
jgi:hypothetical protein